MNLYYFDTSALIKRYVTETGTHWVNTLFSLTPFPSVFISILAVVEGTCAFARRLRERTLSAETHAMLLLAFDYDILHRYYVTDIVPLTIETARLLANRHPLRAYDAVQLATAWVINRHLPAEHEFKFVFISADDRLIKAAQSEGLLTDNPNHHL